MRLIDADTIFNNELLLVSDKAYDAVHAVIERINNAPTVDAVPVVRCKDCVHCKHFNDVWYLPKRDELLCTRCVETYHTTENDFCSMGERKEDADT